MSVEEHAEKSICITVTSHYLEPSQLARAAKTFQHAVNNK